jgi:exonuclease VII large subunit
VEVYPADVRAATPSAPAERVERTPRGTVHQIYRPDEEAIEYALRYLLKRPARSRSSSAPSTRASALSETPPDQDFERRRSG